MTNLTTTEPPVAPAPSMSKLLLELQRHELAPRTEISGCAASLAGRLTMNSPLAFPAPGTLSKDHLGLAYRLPWLELGFLRPCAAVWGRQSFFLGIRRKAALPWKAAGGCSAHHGWSDELGHGQGVTSRGIHAAWHKTASCVSSLRQWRPKAVQRRAVKSCPSAPASTPSVASLCATFSFNFVRSPRLRIDSPAISYLDPGVDSRTWRFVSHRHRPLEEQRRFPPGSTGFRPCFCPHRALFLCCRCAKCKARGGKQGSVQWEMPPAAPLPRA